MTRFILNNDSCRADRMRQGTMGYTQNGDISGKLKRAYQAWGKIKATLLAPAK